MKVFLQRYFGRSQRIEIHEGHRIELPLGGGYISITIEESEVIEEVTLNGAVQHFESIQSSFEIPCFFYQQDEIILRILLKDGRKPRYIFSQNQNFRIDPQLLKNFKDFHRYLLDFLKTHDHQLTYQTLHQAIRQGDLLILARQDAKTGLDQTWLLDQIENALHFLMAVCKHPRQHLRIEEAIRPVEVARRTGPAALRHLASHSEHWEARTVGGLRPARLLAQIVEDDLELYENRFVKTLIDRLLKHINTSRIEVEEILAQIENIIDWDRVGVKDLSYRQYEIFDFLIPSFDSDKAQIDKKTFMDLRDRLVDILQSLTECCATSFYQSLRRCTPVYRPIQPTNILTKDPHYLPLFELWHELDRTQPEPQQAIDGVLPENFDLAYDWYCQIILFAALEFSGFKPFDGDQQIVGILKDGNFCLQGDFVRGDWTITPQIVKEGNSSRLIQLHFTRKFKTPFPLPIHVQLPDFFAEDFSDLFDLEGHQIVFKTKPSDDEFQQIRDLLHIPQNELRRMAIEKKRDLERRDREWRTFIESIRNKVLESEQFDLYIVPILNELGKYAAEVRNSTESLLHDALLNTKQRHARSTIIAIPSSPRSLAQKILDQDDEVPCDAIRRIVNYGDTFTETDSILWGSHQVGMLPISPMSFNSLQRLVRLIRIHTIGTDISLNRQLECCPICEDASNIISLESSGFKCRKCGAEWHQTTCPNCDHQYGFLRPTKLKSRVPKSLDNYGILIERLENMTAGFTIGGFCEARGIEFFSSPVCPKCGKCSKHDENHLLCDRCKSSIQSHSTY